MNSLPHILLPLAAFALSVPLQAQANAPDLAAQPDLVTELPVPTGPRVTRLRLQVPAGSDAATEMPLIVVDGAQPGPTLALVSGLHGAEYASAIALEQLVSEVDPAILSGRLVVLPVVNVAAFKEMRARINPVDGKNFNRAFPGNPQGTQTDRAAALLLREIVAEADVIIDFHTGDIGEQLTPYSFWVTTGDEIADAERLRLLRAFGSPYVIKFDAKGLTQDTATMLGTAGNIHGKLTMTVEAGGAGTYSEADVAQLIAGTRGVMGALGMIEPPVAADQDSQTFVRTTAFIPSVADGYFFPEVAAGDHITAGQIIGRVQALHSGLVSAILAPFAGVVLFRTSTPSAVAGETLFFIGEMDVTSDTCRNSACARDIVQ